MPDIASQTILIVDDSPENLTVLSELLQPIYLVRAATTGTFVAPPTSAEAMYDPAVQGRSPARTVEIVK